MGIVSHLFVLLAALKREDVEQLRPADRERLAQQLRFWAAIAEKQQSAQTGPKEQNKDDKGLKS